MNGWLNGATGFGVAAQSTDYARTEMDPAGYIVLHQADIGEYIRDEVAAAV